MLLALVIGFSLPETSLRRAHVYMEFLVENLSPKWQAAMITFTRLA